MRCCRPSVILCIVWAVLMAQSAIASESLWHHHHDCDERKADTCVVCVLAAADRIGGDDELTYPEFDATWVELTLPEPRTADSRPLPAARARGPPA